MTTRQISVLIVEDHEDTRKYLQLYLEQSGYTVQSASTVKQAVECLSSSECDVLLSDIALRDGTGWELLERLGAPRPMYAIAMSGFGTMADANRSKAAGFRRHLVKPVDPDLLDQALLDARREREGQ